MLKLKQYCGSQTLFAAPLNRGSYCDLLGLKESLFDNEHWGDEGYLTQNMGGTANLKGEKGYFSWLEKEVFEKTFRPSASMPLWDAVAALRLGERVGRLGWDGKFYLNLRIEPYSRPGMPLYEHGPNFRDGAYEEVIYINNAAHKRDQGKKWTATSEDILTNDWCIYRRYQR